MFLVALFLPYNSSTKNTISNQLSKLGYEKMNGIPNIKEPRGFAAVSKDFDEEKRTWTYIMGDAVTNFDEILEGLICFEIPAIKYAVSPIRPINRFAWGWAISRIKKYIYTEWLPTSNYDQTGIIDDFEFHGERSTKKKNPEIDLYVAIKVKE